MLFSFVVKNYTNCFVTQNVNNINSGLRFMADSLHLDSSMAGHLRDTNIVV